MSKVDEYFTHEETSSSSSSTDEEGNQVQTTKYTYKINFVGDDYFANNVFFLSSKDMLLANEYAQNLEMFLSGLDFQGGAIGMSNVSDDVIRHEASIKKYAEKYGIPQFVELIKAVMMQESGGRLVDVMQSAESAYNTVYPKKPNGIKDSDYSIDCGVHYLADALTQAGCSSPNDLNKLSLALQGYNFGTGYISWALKNYGGYSEKNAIEFSNIQKQKLGWKRYGDVNYVKNVMRYFNPYDGSGGGEWGSPFVGRDWKKAVSSEFGYRIDPITGNKGAFHDGLDIAYPRGTPINAVKAGKVTYAGENGNGFGLHVVIDHGDGTKSQYCHCSKLLVKAGQSVQKGDVIAQVGTTGRSTGNHLHLIIYINGKQENPRNYITN